MISIKDLYVSYKKGENVIEGLNLQIIETLTNMCDNIHYLEDGRIKYSVGKEEFQNFEDKIYNSIESKNQELINELMK